MNPFNSIFQDKTILCIHFKYIFSRLLDELFKKIYIIVEFSWILEHFYL